MELPNLRADQIEELIRKDPALASKVLDILEASLRSTDPPYIQALFGPQKAFCQDKSRKKTALCSRRAGKSEAIAAWLLEGAESTPGELSAYVALSRNNARLIMWRAVEALQRRHRPHLDKLKFREKDNQLIIETPGKHQIWLAGCKDLAEIEKFRGPKYKRVAVDEAASFPSALLRALVYDVFEPALMDLKGELALTGTPGAIPAGMFYEVTTGDGTDPDTRLAVVKWPTHHWTVLDNPYVPHAAEERDRKMKENGWDENHPTYRREWLGEWVRDDGALVYPFDSRNIFNGILPNDDAGEWQYTLGIDVGFNDATAMVLVAYRRGLPDLFIVKATKIDGLTPSSLAAHVERLRKQYKIREIVIDTGGLGKGYAEEMQQKYGIPCSPAAKTKKRAYIEVIRGELLSGNIKVNPYEAGCLIDEWQVATWNDDRSAPDDRFEDHASDAALYACRSIITTYRPQTIHAPLTKEERDLNFMAEHKRMLAEKIRKELRRKLPGRSYSYEIAPLPVVRKNY